MTTRHRARPEDALSVPGIGPHNGMQYAPDAIEGAPTLFPRARRERWKGQGQTLVHPQKCGDNDPVTVTLVVDCLLQMQHDNWFYTRELLALLRIRYPNVLWNVGVVGRIMSELYDLANASGAPAKSVIGSGRDRVSHYWRVWPSDRNWIWLGMVRQAVGTLAEETIRKEREHQSAALRTESPFDLLYDLKWGAD